MKKPKFCFECGGPLRRGYPGGDPENGPARMQCPKGCEALVDVIDEAIWEAALTPGRMEEIREEEAAIQRLAAKSEDD
jgi:hypothetical protein